MTRLSTTSGRTSLALAALSLVSLTSPGGAQTTVFINGGKISRFSGSLFGSGIQQVPIKDADQQVMQDVYRACRQISVQTSIFNYVNPAKACGQSAEERCMTVAGVLPVGWQVDKVMSVDLGNLANATGHVLIAVTSPSGGTYVVDTYTGAVEMMVVDKRADGTFVPQSGESQTITGLQATFFMGNYNERTAQDYSAWHFRVTDKGVEQYNYSPDGSWTPVNKGNWYTPQLLGKPGQPQPPNNNTGQGTSGQSIVTLAQWTNLLDAISSGDPNYLDGPAGVGSARFVGGQQLLSYAIGFENVATATAPAAEVIVTATADPAKFDTSTFALGGIVVGSHAYTPPTGAASWSTVVDLRPAQPLLLQIRAGIDAQSGVITWHFSSLDPATGDLPSDATLGFLPPDKTSPEGEGQLTFSIRPKSGLATGATLTVPASIVFDANAPIAPTPWTNTLDVGAPTSHVQSLAAAPTGAFQVTWTGTDDDQGSGVANYDIYVSTDNGPYLPWLAATPKTSATFQGGHGRSYQFFSVATDAVGNVEGRQRDAVTPDASTRTGAPVLLRKGFNFVGLPVLPDQTDPAKLFGFTNNRFAAWLSATGTYARYPDPAAVQLKPAAGQAYWLSLDADASISVPGGLSDRSQAVPLNLVPGWNAIASPYLMPAAWDTAAIKVVSGTVTKSLADAAQAGWVGAYLWSWRPLTQGYQIVFDSNLLPGVLGQVEPWQGYWISASQACQLVIPVPTGEVTSSRRRSAAGLAWVTGLQVQAGDASQQVWLGLSGTRAVQVARPPEPPRTTGSTLQVSLVNDGRPLAVDVRQATAPTAEWTLAVAGAGAGQEVVISWPSFLRQVPPGLIVELTDLATQQTTLLNTHAAWHSAATRSEATRQYRLRVRHGVVGRAAITNMVVAPNRGGTTNVTLALSDTAEVGLVVRGIGGRVVRTIPAQTSPAGNVTLSWDGLDDQGHRVPSGVYQVEATAMAANGAISRAVRVARW